MLLWKTGLLAEMVIIRCASQILLEQKLILAGELKKWSSADNVIRTALYWYTKSPSCFPQFGVDACVGALRRFLSYQVSALFFVLFAFCSLSSIFCQSGSAVGLQRSDACPYTERLSWRSLRAAEMLSHGIYLSTVRTHGITGITLWW